MSSLLIFYRCCSKTLSRYNVVMKFVVIKVLIALHLLQSLAFRWMVSLDMIKDGDEIAEIRSLRIQYLLSIVEMAILAFCLPCTYPINEKVPFLSFDV